MKRLLFVPGFSADTYNSIVKRYVALAKHLRRRIDLVWCLPPDDPDEWIWANPKRKGQTPHILSAVRETGMAIIRMSVHRRSAVGRALRFSRLFAAEHFDGLYTLFTHRFAPLYAGKRAGLTTMWDSAWNSLAPPHRFRYAKRLFYKRYIDCFIAPTPIIAENLAANGIERSCIFVRSSALDTKTIPVTCEDEARPRIRRELSLPDDAEIILQLTSFLPSKNVSMAIRVLKRLLRDRPRAYWILAGEDGPDKATAVELARRLAISKHVRFIGHRNDVWDLMAAADVVALTSMQDGLPNALLEAMASRRPIVATRADGPEYVITDGDHGYVVEPNDDERFSECLARLLADPQLRWRMGTSGRAHVEREYQMDVWCRRLADYIAESLGAGRGSAS